MHKLVSLAVLAALALAGCTNTAQPVEPVQQTGDLVSDTQGSLNNTTRLAYKGPVARMQVFDVNGALVYESNFVADNTTAQAPVSGGAPVTFLGSLSEAVEKTARVESWEWDFGDGGKATGRGANHTFRDTGGVFRVTLKVRDSHNLTDVQVVTLGVEATRLFTEAVALEGALQAGTGALGREATSSVDTASHDLPLAGEVQGYRVMVEGLSVLLEAGEPTSDFDFYLYDPEGVEVASSANGPAPGGTETITLGPGEAAAGAYKLVVVFVGGANGTYTLSGEVVYKVVNEQVAGMFGGHEGH